MTPAERHGLWFGVAGVAIFALTLPMTRLAVGTPEAPLMSGMFVALGRAAVAGALSVLFLLVDRAPLPRRSEWRALAITSGGVVFGFPVCTSIAMRHVEAVHASVIIGVLPLATALVGALLHRQRPSRAFWACAAVGSVLVAAFAVLRSGSALRAQAADALLLAAILFAAVGYAWGGRLSQRMRAEHVICWALVLALPVSVPLAFWTRPQVPLPTGAWLGFAYVCVFSMWIGFFAWYRGLALGGTVRVSQVQLVQPFLSMMFAVPLLHERLDAMSVGFALAVIATVFVGRRMPVGRASAPPVLAPAVESR
ncbi:DMT family transporter [Ramlibacter alkalitolerans]|uniref:DMT family transporter n=1 Tax=Ramlibacter alkalitolerans TaxID=2039631 RepID=A0ABS1JWA4_9BURK|nr:DMT family transporter [Ramlibacter alkalitolerans]MBL0428381.1 DMT family transporter [Ramlibacter alkalitolerans]